MNQLNADNVDSQKVEFRLDSNTNSATISGFREGAFGDIIIKRGVMDTGGKIYKVVGIDPEVELPNLITSIVYPF